MTVDSAELETFGPYLVYERLGVGGMATVHRALEQAADGSERVVALKRLLPHLAEDASFIKSFVREAKLASLLHHPNIVRIHELGRVGTEYFISMEHIDGRDLRRVLRHARRVTGPPPINVALGLILQLCDALDYAHNKLDDDGEPLGIVHRDISPSNLIVTSTGQLKIIDFGIAKAQATHLRTHTGRVKGKLAYMAPEAVSTNAELDGRSDIWATGVILHELCTARPLFGSKNEYQTLLRVQKGDIVPPSGFNQDCPPELDAIVMRALARDLNKRYPSAAALRADLRELAAKHALQSAPRFIASWIDWAFGVAAPESLSGDAGVVTNHTWRMSGKPPRSTTRDRDEDEAVDVVWGGASADSIEGPVVLDDVPDVSEKHRARRDTDDDRFQVDDIPTPLPSHGVMPSIYSEDEPRVPIAPEPPALRIIRPSTATGRHAAAPRAQRPTSPGVAPAAPSDRMPAGLPPHVDVPLLADRMAAQRARDSEAPPNVTTTPVAPPPTAEEVFGAEAAAVLASISAQVELMSTQPAMVKHTDDAAATLEPPPQDDLPSVPIVRFSKSHSVPPPIAEARDAAESAAETGRVIQTKLGVEPASANSLAPSPRRSAATVPAKLPLAPAGARQRWLIIVAGLLIAAGTATIVALAVTGAL